MDASKTYHGLRFERHPQTVSRRLITIGSALAAFILLWVSVPHSALFWLLLASWGVLAWAASYGWRQVVSALHDLLHRLGEL